MPILPIYAPTPAPALTAHLRHHLLAQYRADLKRDRDELAHIPRQRLRRDNMRRAHLLDRIAATQAEIATMEGA